MMELARIPFKESHGHLHVSTEDTGLSPLGIFLQGLGTVVTETCIPLSLTLFVAAFLVIAFMGMFMIMFRSAYLAVDDSEEDDVAFKQGHAMGEHVDDYEDEDHDAAHHTYPDTSPRASDDDYSDDDDVYTNTGDDHYDQYEPYEVDDRNRVHHRATAPSATLY